MSPAELEALAVGVAKIAAFCGAAGALAVLIMASLLRQFTDWFIEREQRLQRIAAARARAEYLP